MITLRLASLVAAITTLILNAHAGFVFAATIEYAILFACLSAALDLAKCSLLPAASLAFRTGRIGIACLALTVFPFFFMLSVINAVSQTTKSLETAKTGAIADVQTRARTQASYNRLTNELALLQGSPMFATTQACTIIPTRAARTYCDTLAQTKRDLAAIETGLTGPAPVDPTPHITFLSSITHQPIPTLTLLLNLFPVLLAELLGSLGFVIAATGSRSDQASALAKAAATTPIAKSRLGTLRSRLRQLRLGWPRPTCAKPPAPLPKPSATPSPRAPTPTPQWNFRT